VAAARSTSAITPVPPLEAKRIIALDGFEGSGQQRGSRYNDDVPAPGVLVVTEHLSNHPFSSISLHGTPDFFRGRDAEPRRAFLLREQKNRHQLAMHTDAAVVDGPVFLSAPQTAGRMQTAIKGAGQRRTTPAVRRISVRTRSAAFAPWRGGV
jgi:hypothetical protein